MFLIQFKVPLYDGHAGMKHPDRGFDFSDADFQSLLPWPHFDMTEALTDAAVAIGYTTNMYKLREVVYLSTNILFVIVLGFYSDADAS